MSLANKLWGAPRIHGELLKLGIDVAESTVSKYMVKQRKEPSQTWKTFLKNHVKDIVAVDFLVVPTIKFKLLFAFIVMAHDRRKVIHFNVTRHPTSKWTAQQIVEAFPWDTAPRYMIRDRDSIYGNAFKARVKNMGIEEVVTAYKSPLQNVYIERMIGSIRREENAWILLSFGTSGI
jgi:hypothetical protein